MRLSLLTAFLSAAACLVTPLARAADAISTDRPDFVESSDVVGNGLVQIEAGFAAERDSHDGMRLRTRSTPTLVRLGVSDTIELRVETDGRIWAKSDDRVLGPSSRRGWSDVALGVKWHAEEGNTETGRPSIAWLAQLELDSGSSAFRGQGLRPSLRIVAEWELPHEMSVGVMPGIVLDRNEDDRRFAGGILAVTLGKAWTPVWRTYVEVAGQQLASKRNGGSVVTFDTGATYLVNDSFQVDLSLQRGLSHEAPDFAWGIGASIRF